MSTKTKTTKAKRLEEMEAANTKLDNHINEGVNQYVEDIYGDSKEARKNQRWYQTGEAIKAAKVQAQRDADTEFMDEFRVWAEKEQEAFYAELDSNEQAMLMANDNEDVIEVEYKEIAPKRRERKSLLGNDVPVTKQIEGAAPTTASAKDVRDPLMPKPNLTTPKYKGKLPPKDPLGMF